MPYIRLFQGAENNIIFVMKKTTQGSLFIIITYLNSISYYESVLLMVELGGKAIFPGKPKQKENDLKGRKIFLFFCSLTIRNHKVKIVL